MKVISGGQTGVDQAALRAAKKAGFETGGWMPFGYKTQNGCEVDFAIEYGLKQHKSSKYQPRTYANVRDADATLQLMSEEATLSPGEVCTRKAVRHYQKPVFEIVFNLKSGKACPSAETIAHWLGTGWSVEVLNVAGNSERTAPGIGKCAEAYLMKVFELLKEGKA